MQYSKVLIKSALTTQMNYKKDAVMGNLETGELMGMKSSDRVFDVYHKIPLCIDGFHHLIRMRPLQQYWEKIDRYYSIDIPFTELKKAIYGTGKNPGFMREFFNAEIEHLEKTLYGAISVSSKDHPLEYHYDLLFSLKKLIGKTYKVKIHRIFFEQFETTEAAGKNYYDIPDRLTYSLYEYLETYPQKMLKANSLVKGTKSIVKALRLFYYFIIAHASHHKLERIDTLELLSSLAPSWCRCTNSGGWTSNNHTLKEAKDLIHELYVMLSDFGQQYQISHYPMSIHETSDERIVSINLFHEPKKTEKRRLAYT